MYDHPVDQRQWTAAATAVRDELSAQARRSREARAAGGAAAEAEAGDGSELYKDCPESLNLLGRSKGYVRGCASRAPPPTAAGCEACGPRLRAV